MLKGLYVITDETLYKGRTHADIAKSALEGGANIIQIRDKNCNDRYFYEQALEIKKMTKAYNAIFIVNDRIHIAIAVDADGINCGQKDLPCSVVKELLGKDKIIGISCSSVEMAIKAQEDGADYIGLGPIFSTTTKVDCDKTTGLEMIKNVKSHIKIPVAAIGGINSSNINLVGEYGSDMACVVSCVVCADDMIKETKKLNLLFN